MPHSATQHFITAGEVGQLTWDLLFTGPDRGYLARNHIFLWVNDIQLGVGGGAGTPGFTWVHDTRVSLVGYVPVLGDKLEFRRTMPNENIYRQFTDGAGLTESQLRDQALANLYAIHEIVDGFGTGIYSSYVLARQYATNPVGITVDDPDYPGSFSSLHWAFQSLTSAGDADVARLAAEAAEIQTGLDAAATAADRVQTGLDAVATAADRVQTGLDRVQTGLDAVATAADLVQTDLDTIATAADRAQTGLDAIDTAADRVQTGLDAIDTAADRVQTGIDASNAAASALAAEGFKDDAELAAASVTLPLIVAGDESKVLRVNSALSGYGLHDLSNDNLLINGCLRVWQRGINFSPLTSQHQYTADRWYVSNGTGHFANRRVAQNSSGGLYVNEMLLIRLVTDVATTIMGAWQRLEPYDVFRLRGKTVTFSAYLRCGHSFSATDSEATLHLITSSNEDTTFGGTPLGSGGAFPDAPVGSRVQNTEVVTVSTTPTRFSITVTIPADAWQIQVGVSFLPVGSASDTADWLGMQEVQLEVGSVPTDMEIRPLALETAMCERYYEIVNQYYIPAVATTTALLRTVAMFKTQKRTTPTIVEKSGNARYLNAGTWITVPPVDLAMIADQYVALCSITVTGVVTAAAYVTLMTFSVDAEL